MSGQKNWPISREDKRKYFHTWKHSDGKYAGPSRPSGSAIHLAIYISLAKGIHVTGCYPMSILISADKIVLADYNACLGVIA